MVGGVIGSFQNSKRSIELGSCTTQHRRLLTTRVVMMTLRILLLLLMHLRLLVLIVRVDQVPHIVLQLARDLLWH